MVQSPFRQVKKRDLFHGILSFLFLPNGTNTFPDHLARVLATFTSMNNTGRAPRSRAHRNDVPWSYNNTKRNGMRKLDGEWKLTKCMVRRVALRERASCSGYKNVSDNHRKSLERKNF